MFKTNLANQVLSILQIDSKILCLWQQEITIFDCPNSQMVSADVRMSLTNQLTQNRRAVLYMADWEGR